MRSLFILAVLCVASWSGCHGCQGTEECTKSCADGYHEQCVSSACTCLPHMCNESTKCPQGSGSGCPPFCTTMCNNNMCMCKCSNV